MFFFNHISRWIASKRHKENMAEFNRDFDINAAQDRANVPGQIQALRGKAVTPWWRKEEDDKVNDHGNIVTSLDIIYERINGHELAVRDLKNVEVVIDLCNKYEKELTRTRYTWTGQRRLDWVRAVKWRLVLMLAQACEDKMKAISEKPISENIVYKSSHKSYIEGVSEFIGSAMDVISRVDTLKSPSWAVNNMLESLYNVISRQVLLASLYSIKDIAKNNLEITPNVATQ